MTYEQQRTTIEHDAGSPAYPPMASPDRVVQQRDRVVVRPSGGTVISRIVIVVFGIIELLILLRVLLLALDARQANDLVAGILNASQVFVAPFEGVFRTDSLAAGGSVLDIAALVALIAWVIVEAVILAIVRIPRHTEAV